MSSTVLPVVQRAKVSVIMFRTFWGLFLVDWRGSGRCTMKLVWLGLFALVASTIIVGYGNYLGGRSGRH